MFSAVMKKPTKKTPMAHLVIPGQLHARLKSEAAIQGVSLGKYAAEKLTAKITAKIKAEK